MNIKTIVRNLKCVVFAYDRHYYVILSAIVNNKQLHDIFLFYIKDVKILLSMYRPNSPYNSIYTMTLNVLIPLDKYKQDKLKFIIDTHNKFIKYIDFALEECDASMKLLLSIGASGKWTNQFDEMVNKIIHTDVQRYKYFISSQINIPLFDVKYIYGRTYNLKL
jgi:hypothetical protein